MIMGENLQPLIDASADYLFVRSIMLVVEPFLITGLVVLIVYAIARLFIRLHEDM